MKTSVAKRAFAGALLATVATCRPHAPMTPAPVNPGDVVMDRQKSEAAGIVVQEVDEQPVEDTMLTSGVIAFDEQKVSHVMSPVSGRVTAIHVEHGDRVKKGQPLATLQSLDVAQVIADVRKAETAFTTAEHDFTSLARLKDDGAASTRELEAAEDRCRQARAELERAEFKARLFRTGSVNTVTNSYTLVSNIDGEVMMRNLNLGQEIAGQYANGGAQELFTIGEIDRVWALGDVYEVDIPRVEKGAHAAIEVIAYKGKLFEGRVEWVQHVLDPITRTAKVRFSFPNPDRALLPEMYGTVRIAVNPRKALAIPRSALVRLGDQRVVFVQADGAPRGGELRFERVPVDVDEYASAEWVPVRHGLEKGMKLVVKGAPLLSEM
jgi:cobalt-zinc-cadmium efflux system membrane fusion protein